MKCAVIDLSSTGVSTVIAEGEKSTGVFEAIYKDRTNIAVADYFDGKGISSRGIEKLIDALITARSNCKAMGVEECYCISTAALRNVNNIEEVAERIRMRTGIVINHLDGKTEAYCDFVSNRKYSAYDRVILIDLGGGSVELCDFSKDEKSEMICLDFGPIKLRNKYVNDIYPTKEEEKKIKKFLRKKADEEQVPGKDKFSTAVLVGSINDAICAVYSEYCEKKKLGSDFTYDKYKGFVKWLFSSSDRTRLIMKAAPEKINVLPVAALILKEMLKRFKLDNIVISDCGVKEGYLALIMSGKETGVPIKLNEPIPDYAPTELAPIEDADKKEKPVKAKASVNAKKPRTNKSTKPVAAKAEKRRTPGKTQTLVAHSAQKINATEADSSSGDSENM